MLRQGTDIVLVSTSCYKSTGLGLNPGHSACSSPNCGSCLSRVFDKLGTLRNPGNVNSGNPIITLAAILWGLWIVSHHREMAMSAEDKCSNTMSLNFAFDFEHTNDIHSWKHKRGKTGRMKGCHCKGYTLSYHLTWSDLLMNSQLAMQTPTASLKWGGVANAWIRSETVKVAITNRIS